MDAGDVYINALNSHYEYLENKYFSEDILVYACEDCGIEEEDYLICDSCGERKCPNCSFEEIDNEIVICKDCGEY